MAVIDTLLLNAVNPGAGGAAGSAAASGDPTIVRAFPTSAKAYLDVLTRMGTTAGFAQVASPALHDPVTGIRITPGESPSGFGVPGVVGQPLTSGDQLSFTISGGAAETDVAAAHLYYTDAGSLSARLFSQGDIQGNVENLKTQRVAVTSAATIGAWADTSATATENLLVAGKDYAVLGYDASVALAVVGVRGTDTGNLRACGPGILTEYETSNYFWYLAGETNRPYIPVFNQLNLGNLFVSVAAATASVAAVVTLILAELTNTLPGAPSR